MTRYAWATIAASALATLTIGLAAPATAEPIALDNNNGTNFEEPVYPTTGQTPYGTYQNDHKAGSPNRR